MASTLASLLEAVTPLNGIHPGALLNINYAAYELASSNMLDRRGLENMLMKPVAVDYTFGFTIP